MFHGSGGECGSLVFSLIIYWPHRWQFDSSNMYNQAWWYASHHATESLARITFKLDQPCEMNTLVWQIIRSPSSSGLSVGVHCIYLCVVRIAMYIYHMMWSISCDDGLQMVWVQFSKLSPAVPQAVISSSHTDYRWNKVLLGTVLFTAVCTCMYISIYVCLCCVHHTRVTLVILLGLYVNNRLEIVALWLTYTR